MSYMRYNKTATDTGFRYQYVSPCSFFGKHSGDIPNMLRLKMPKGQGEPYDWHVNVPDGLKKIAKPGEGNAFLIDLMPNQKKWVSRLELLDVWGYSNDGWTPLALRLESLLYEARGGPSNPKDFVLRKKDREPLIHTFIYARGGIENGEFTGTWNSSSRTINSAILHKPALRHFVKSIAESKPNLLGGLFGKS
ncbi:MAG: hypothetical protein MPK09_05505 [Gammaproteobacteria bacterium]|nr:hypothetical protein [Gammaproteobacteria bacterium]